LHHPKQHYIEKRHGLEKVLSYKAILIITINSILGTGIFFLPAVGAKHAGPASIISWIILSVIGIYISMCFAELTSMFPKEGGVYEFCKQAFGRFWSFIIGWMTMIAGYVTIAMLVVGAIHYLLPYDLPWIKIPVSILFIIIFNYVAYKGMQTSKAMLIAFGFITLGTLFLLVFPGIFRFDSANMVPFFALPKITMFLAVFFIAETFFGWETATFLAGETKDGEKVMPKALITATVIIAFICIIFVVTSLGVIPWEKFGSSGAPFIDLSRFHYGSVGADIFTLLVYLAIIGSVAGWIVSAPRLLLAMAEDKLFPSQLSHVHPKYKTPYKAIFFQTIIIIVLVFLGSGSYNTLVSLLVPIVLVMYSAVLFSMVVLRYKKPNLKRYFKAPAGVVGPLLTILVLLGILAAWVMHEADALLLVELGFLFILCGLPVYFLIEMYFDPVMIIKVNDFFAYITYLTERLTLPKRVRQEMIRLLGDMKGKSIMEYGCGVGTLTLLLAEEVTAKGKIYATDESKHALEILKKRVEKKEHRHVKLYLDKPNKVHPTVPKIDAVVSIGMIGYLQKEEEVLRQINKRLAKGAKIVMLDYDRFFDVIPNIEWLSSDKRIKQVFKKCGFRVKVDRKWDYAWQNIYIYGTKVRSVR